MVCLHLLLVTLLCLLETYFALGISTKIMASATAAVLSLSTLEISSPLTLAPPVTSLVLAKDELPALEKCFGAVRKELSPEGESLKRLASDIESGDFKDMIAFTREYDAGFRGGVLKAAWKQLGPAKKRGIEVSNSFTFDLIALNKAARGSDKVEAQRALGLVRQDLVDFLTLENFKE
jgi:hypothetical protein